MSGLTPTGFVRKRLTEIKTDIETNLKSAFGKNIDLSAQSGFGQFIGILAEALSNSWESQENIYNSQYPSTAQKTQLSNVVEYNGIERKSATNSTVDALITGTYGTILVSGSKAKTADTGKVFQTTAEVTIPVSGEITVTMTAMETGEIQAAVNTLTVIETPVFGWVSVNNPIAATVGQEEETDAALRERRKQSFRALAQNLIDGLYAQLVNIAGVEDCRVVDNKTESSIPIGYFQVLILGGDVDAIAEAIWLNNPQGIISIGTTEINITDSQGYIQVMRFVRPADVDMYVRVNITEINPAEFPATASDDIKEAVVTYGTSNFKISDDVIRTEFYTPINQTPGILNFTVELSINGVDWITTNQAIGLTEISRFDAGRITVNVP